MARLPRLKVHDDVGWYHLCARVAGWLDWFPFEEDPVAGEQLLRTLRKYLSVYFCEAAGFCLMGNHYHLIVRFCGFRHLSSQELYRRAQQLYPEPDRVLRTRRQWQRFHRRLFDVSEFMRNVQQSYAKWYNGRYQRRGSFWGERFKSSILADQEALLNALVYVELNPVRAHLVERPEQWRWGSASLRQLRQDSWLIPLEDLFENPKDKMTVYADYRGMLYHRGAIQTKPDSGIIRQELFEAEQARGFRHAGAYGKRLRFFTDGLVLGSRLQVEDWIRDLRRRGYYLRRKHSIRQMVDQATVYTLREQRRIPMQA
jgi:REP element-mobilizing transposase RayT